MGFRVQFTITEGEQKQLEKEALEEGYPNLSELCKDRALKGKSSYSNMYHRMVQQINDLEPGTTFRLRDLIDTPPSLLGKWLFDNVANGKIPNVKHLGNNGIDSEEYLKL